MTAAGDPHGRPADDVVRDLGADAARGLTAAEADERLAREGPNTSPPSGAAARCGFSCRSSTAR